MTLIPTPEIGKFIRTCRQNLADISDVVAKNTDLIGPLEHVPFIGVAMKIYNVIDVWQQQKLARNAKAFLEVFQTGDHNAIGSRLDELSRDPRFADAVDESVFATMMDSSHKERSRLHAKLLLAVADGRITVEEFIILSEIVQSTIVASLRALPGFFEMTSGRPFYRSVGPTQYEPLLNTLGVSARSGNQCRVSELGQKLFEVCFDGAVIQEPVPLSPENNTMVPRQRS
ncbi:hypothetical protein [Burkholderia gladioli]|uniref:hypothetical protein n=1 Tax=Burkholderia gladioli TaxID=28095 RepID=UPI00163F9CCD|nr:hypothetical protein [Burkholderia gladioli]